MHTKETIARLLTWWTLTAGVTVAVVVKAVLALAGVASFHWLWLLSAAVLWAFGLAAMDAEDKAFMRALLRWMRVKAAGAYSILAHNVSRAVRGLSALFSTHHIQTEP